MSNRTTRRVSHRTPKEFFSQANLALTTTTNASSPSTSPTSSSTSSASPSICIDTSRVSESKQDAKLASLSVPSTPSSLASRHKSVVHHDEAVIFLKLPTKEEDVRRFKEDMLTALSPYIPTTLLNTKEVDDILSAMIGTQDSLSVDSSLCPLFGLIQATQSITNMKKLPNTPTSGKVEFIVRAFEQLITIAHYRNDYKTITNKFMAILEISRYLTLLLLPVANEKKYREEVKRLAFLNRGTCDHSSAPSSVSTSSAKVPLTKPVVDASSSATKPASTSATSVSASSSSSSASAVVEDTGVSKPQKGLFGCFSA